MNILSPSILAADCAKLEEMLTIISRELMPEVDIPEIAASGK